MLMQAFEVSSKGQDLVKQREVSALQDLRPMHGLLVCKVLRISRQVVTFSSLGGKAVWRPIMKMVT